MGAFGNNSPAFKSATLLGWLDQNPRTAFAAFCLIHIAVWTLVPTVLYPNLPLDLIEARTYGPEWQLGYDKLPPMPWWMIEVMYRLVGADWSYYLLSQVVVVAAFAIVWLAALPLVGAAGALASVLIVDGLHYFNFTAAKFNHDVAQLPFWALAGFAFHRAMREGRLGSWALLGAALGLAFWAKYFIVMLAIPMALFVLIDPVARRALRTPGPYVAIAVGLLVVLPHLIWLIANDFLPLAYAETRLAPARGALDHLTRPLIFVAGQLFWLIPSLLIALPLLYPRNNPPTPAVDPRDRRIITLIVFGPASLLVAGGLERGPADHHVGLSVLAVPRALAGDARARPARPAAARANQRHLGPRDAGLRARLCRGLRRASVHRGPLPGIPVSGRPSGGRDLRSLSLRDRNAAELRHFRHVAGGQYPSLWRHPSADSHRGEAGAHPLGRSRRRSHPRSCGGVDRRRSNESARGLRRRCERRPGAGAV